LSRSMVPACEATTVAATGSRCLSFIVFLAGRVIWFKRLLA
jgi:hypothetical protein